jgi:outer membrane protein OmpA-like peptidoglycan-associated protein
MHPTPSHTHKNRHFTHSAYRYAFNSMEKDDEVKGEGNSINYTYRMHDTRLGRFFAVDPLFAQYAYNSTYAFSENRVVDAIELEGLEKYLIVRKTFNGVVVKSTIYKVPEKARLSKYDANDVMILVDVVEDGINPNFTLTPLRTGQPDNANVRGINLKLREFDKNPSLSIIKESEVLEMECPKLNKLDKSEAGKEVVAVAPYHRVQVNFTQDRGVTPQQFQDNLTTEDIMELNTNIAVANASLVPGANIGVVSITIIGNASTLTTNYRGDNQQLSLDRATAAQQYLLNNGLDPRININIVAAGTTNPVDPGNTDNVTNQNTQIQLNIDRTGVPVD